jgi:putative transposase
VSILKAYKFKLYPTKKQVEAVQETLNRCRELYNAALQERRDAYEMCIKRHPNYYDEEIRRQLGKQYAITYSSQSAQLPEVKGLRPEYGNVHSQVLQDVLRRVQKTMDGFFRRVKEGQIPGYPRFQAYGRYNSFTYPQLGFSLTQDHRVCLSKIGTIKLKMPKVNGKDGKKVPYLPDGQIKTCTIKREGDLWFVVLTAEVEPELVSHSSTEATGVDMGLLDFATLADGSTIENPRHLRQSEGKLKSQQQKLAHQKKGSARRRKAAKNVGKQHRHIRNQRRDFHHKEARKLVNTYQTIVFEKLQPANMSRRPKPKQDPETGAYHT